MKYLIFDETTLMLSGFFETLTGDTSINGILVAVDEFPAITEGTTLQLNADGTWGVVDIIPVV